MDTKKLHQSNLNIIRQALKKVDYATKNSLSADTGLSVATCGNILNKMITTNEVIELALDQSSGGRPARRFKYNQNYATALLINLLRDGYDQMEFKMVSYMGTILQELTVDLEDITPALLLNRIQDIIKDTNTKVISISVPGIAHNGIIKDCDIKALEFTNLAKYIYKRTHIKTMINNDVNLATLSYYSSFSKPKPECVVYLYYPNAAPPGMGIVVNDQIIFGANNFAGEIKHTFSFLPIDKQLQVDTDFDVFLELLMKQIHTITAILNPSHVIVSGKHFSSKNIRIINDRLKSSVIHEYMPKVLKDTNINKSIFMGLQKLAILELEKILKEVKL